MRAYEISGIRGFDSISPTERPDPSPARGQILIRMHAWSLNYRDLLIINGRYNGLVPDRVMPLSDGAGEVVAVGPDVQRFKVGDRVSPAFSSTWIAGSMAASDFPTSLGGAIDGTLAEYVVCDQQVAVKIPAHLSYQEAACLPCAGVTAWNALFGPRPLVPGQTVLTLGTGGVSTFAIQFASLAGARVISTSSSDTKLATARQLGASDTINYQQHPEWQDEVMRLTDGQGVDHVVEVGGGGTIERSIASTAFGGQVHMIGVLTEGVVNPLPLIPWRTLRGVLVGSRGDYEQMNQMVAYHQLRPLIDRVFSFEEAISAYRYLDSGSHAGKVVIEFAS